MQKQDGRKTGKAGKAGMEMQGKNGPTMWTAGRSLFRERRKTRQTNKTPGGLPLRSGNAGFWITILADGAGRNAAYCREREYLWP